MKNYDRVDNNRVDQPVKEWNSRDYEEKLDRMSDEMEFFDISEVSERSAVLQTEFAEEYNPSLNGEYVPEWGNEYSDAAPEEFAYDNEEVSSKDYERFEEDSEEYTEADYAEEGSEVYEEAAYTEGTDEGYEEAAYEEQASYMEEEQYDESASYEDEGVELMELGTTEFEAVDPDSYHAGNAGFSTTQILPNITAENYEMAQEFEDGVYDLADDEKAVEYEEYEEYEEFDDSEEYDEDDDAGVSFFHRLANRIRNMRAIDWVIAGTGVVVIILAIIVGNMTLGRTRLDNSAQVAALNEIGIHMDEIGIVGENGLTSVTNMTIDRLAAAKAETIQTLVEEAGTDKIAIMLNITTLDHDLKIKFVNAETNKMVGGYEFMVEVTFPSGNTEVYTDTDRDGKIHIEKLSAGNYSCKIVENPDITSDKFVWSLLSVSTNVKDTIEYVKVDVDDEIKTVDQIVEAEEDLQEEEAAPVESVLQDTVEWVESTKTTIGSNASYTEIKLEDIKDPVVASANKTFMRTEEPKTVDPTPIDPSPADPSPTPVEPSPTTDPVDPSPTPIEPSPTPVEPSPTPVEPSPAEESATKATVSISPEINNLSLEAQPNDGNYTFTVGGLKNPDAFNISWNISIPGASAVTGTGTSCQASFGKTAGTVTAEATVVSKTNPENKANPKMTITITAKAATEEKASDLSVGVDLTATFKNTTTLSNTVVNWTAESSDPTVVKVESAVDGVATVKGVKEGTATVTMYAKAPEGTVYHKVVCKVTVTKGVSASIDAATLKIAGGKTADLTITVANMPEKATWKVEWASADTAVATVATKESADAAKKIATVTGVSSVKESKTVKITATVTVTLNDKIIYTTGLSSDITVTPAAAGDTTSILYTKNNEVVYTMKDGAYVTAVYADFYDKNLKFYKKNEKAEYKYTGWQTINGNTYYYDKNGNKVTGDQVIMGAQYHFASDGALITGSGSLGIDVSKWNGNINWSAVANSGVSYVIIRCGYRGASTGALIEDVKFKTNIQGANNAGLKVGVYFFSQAMTEGEAVEEASMCLSLVSGYRVSYPIFIDLEKTSGGRANNISSADRTKVAAAFCRTIVNGGYKAGIYANKEWLTSKMDAGSLSSYNIWLAQYAAQPTYTGKYNLWQYSAKGKINGISGDVDLDISYLGY